VDRPRSAWLDGELVPYDDATVHLSSSALHFGPVAFEGIRCYGFPDGRTNLFRLTEHVERLGASARGLHLEVPFSPPELAAACRRTVVANGHHDAYIRPVAFPAPGGLGFGRPGGRAQTCVLSFPWRNDVLEKSQRRGIRLHVSSVTRTEAHPVISKSKISANYAAGLLAMHEARQAGVDDALLLDATGAVAEATTANVFAVWGERVVTPPLSLPILAGITRDALLVLGRQLGLDVGEKAFDVDELGAADEIFLCGTTSEVTPVREVDGRAVGDGTPGPVTIRLLRALQDEIGGHGATHPWSHPLSD
jgi:branched-chain amino acid aminotransferase